jgi:hypothetical protein
MLRPPVGDLALRIALPIPDSQLPEAVVDDRVPAEPRRERCRRLHGTGERARHKPVDRLLTKDIGDRRGGPNPSRLDALVKPTHRPALAVRGRAAVADQVNPCHPAPLSLLISSLRGRATPRVLLSEDFSSALWNPLSERLELTPEECLLAKCLDRLRGASCHRLDEAMDLERARLSPSISLFLGQDRRERRTKTRTSCLPRRTGESQCLTAA